MPAINIEKLTKTYGQLNAVDDLNYSFEDGKVTCLLGPSGCGKTTLMRMISGLEEPTFGKIKFDELDVTDLPTATRNIGMVFQSPVVYRGLDVYRNIELPLLNEKLSAAEIKNRVENSIELLDLKSIAREEAISLDHVLRQKVAVARVVARQPEIILFDEPLTNMDANAKMYFKRTFKELTQSLKQTIVYVTHDQTEAMTFADYIALMDNGRIMQYDHPRELYLHPRHVFGGWFLGNPGMNFFDAELRKEDGKQTAVLPLLLRPFLLNSGRELSDGIKLGIRPEHIQARNAQDDAEFIPARSIRKWISIGGQVMVLAEAGGIGFKLKIPASLGTSLNEDFFVRLPHDKLVAFDENGDRLAAAHIEEE